MAMTDYPCGDGPCGYDPVRPGASALGADAAMALFFDLTTRTFPPLADGSLQEIHWVDAAVTLALGFEAGSIPCSPLTGFNTAPLRRVSRAAAFATCADLVKTALKNLLDAGHITIRGVDVDASRAGRIAVSLVYTNNRISGPKPPGTRLNIASALPYAS